MSPSPKKAAPDIEFSIPTIHNVCDWKGFSHHRLPGNHTPGAGIRIRKTEFLSRTKRSSNTATSLPASPIHGDKASDALESRLAETRLSGQQHSGSPSISSGNTDILRVSSLTPLEPEADSRGAVILTNSYRHSIPHSPSYTNTSSFTISSVSASDLTSLDSPRKGGVLAAAPTLPERRHSKRRPAKLESSSQATKMADSDVSESSDADSDDSDVIYVSTGSHESASPVIDTPSTVKVVTHPSYEIFAIFSNFSLSLVSFDLLLKQQIFDPTASSDMMNENYGNVGFIEYPIRLQEASLCYSTCTSPCKTTRSRSSKHSPLNKLLCASWHRESLTLAVGSETSFLIFKITANRSPNCMKDPSKISTFGVQCVFFSHVDWPCSKILWIGDCLLTKSTFIGSNIHSMKELHQLKASTLPSSQFFFWKCHFNRHRGPSTQSQKSVPFFEPSLLTGAIAPDDMLQCLFNSSPTLRDEFDPYALFSEFASISDCPIFSWRAVAGANIRALSPLPSLETMERPHDKFVIKIRSIIPHTASRFLAVLYSVSVVSNEKYKESKSATTDRRGKQADTVMFSVPSPVVRLWSIRPRAKTLSDNGEDLFDEGEYQFPDASTEKASKKKNFLNFHGMRHKQGGGNKFSSCFLSGVSGLFHLKHKRDIFVKSSTKEEAEMQERQQELENELQGCEISMLHQMTTANFETWRRPSRIHSSKLSAVGDQKASLMAILVARGLVSEEDLSMYQSALLNSGIFMQNSITEVSPAEIKSKMNFNFEDHPQLGLIPAVVDGPYLCTSLNHKAPVLELQWRDDGPTLDTVFIPSVACVLTMDNCITIWLESPSEVELWFEAVILLRLDISPMKNFFHPLDMLNHSAQRRLSSSSTKQTMPGVRGSLRHSATVSECGGLERHNINTLASFGLCSNSSEDLSVTFCWLTGHHAPLDSKWSDNFLRFSRAEAEARLVELSLLGSGREFQSKDDNEFDGFLSLRPSGHSLLGEMIPRIISSTGVLNKKASFVPAAICYSSAEHMKSKMHWPKMSVTHRQNSVDFLLLCEVSRGPDALFSFPTNQSHGLWVYAFRELSSQPRGSPAVKRLLEPRHVPIPCKVRSILCVETLKSLGFSDVCWGDGSSAVIGHPVVVTDGILLPPCLITVMTVGGEIWSFCIRPSIESHHQTQADKLILKYEIHFKGSYGKWKSPFHVLNKRGVTENKTDEASTPLAEAPSQNLTSPVTPLSKLKMIYWKYLEEHPLIPNRVLALDNRGWLSLGSLNSTVSRFREERDNVASPQSTGLISRSVSGATTKKSVFHFSKRNNLPDFLRMTAASDLVCLHATGQQWVDSYLTEHPSLVRTKTKHEIANDVDENSRSRPSPPSFRSVVWLPLATHPPILLAVTEPDGQLLPLEATLAPGRCPRIKGLAFIGSYCESLLNSLHLTPHHVSKDQEKMCSIGSIHAIPRCSTECILVVRISLGYRFDKIDSKSSDTRILREEHIVVVKCHESRIPADSFTSDCTVQGHSNGGRALKLEMIADAFLDFSSRHITLLPFSSNRTGLDNESLGNSNVKEIIEIEPQICVCEVPTAGGVLAIMASYPPLDASSNSRGSKANLVAGQDHGGRSSTDSFVGIYDLIENEGLKLCAWAAVPTRKSLKAGGSIESDPVVGLAMTFEWVAVITKHANLYMFSLLESPPLPSVSSLSHLFVTVGVALGLTMPCLGLAVPVLSPSNSFSLQQQFSTLRFEAEQKKRNIENYINRLESEGERCKANSLSGELGEDDQVKYFKESKKFFDERLQIDTKKRDIPVFGSPSELKAKSAGTKKKHQASRPLKSTRHDNASILSFRQTKGDGLCLLITLKQCVMELYDGEHKEESVLSESIGLDLPPHCTPVLLLRSRKGGVESWWKSSIPLVPGCETLMLHDICWSAEADQLLLSASLLPYAFQDGCFPVLSARFPHKLSQLVNELSSPRPIYHPSSLLSLFERVEHPFLVLKILKRLLEALMLWRHTGKPLTPSLDLPVEFLTSKPVDWAVRETRNTNFRDQLIQRLKDFTGGKETEEKGAKKAKVEDLGITNEALFKQNEANKEFEVQEVQEKLCGHAQPFREPTFEDAFQVFDIPQSDVISIRKGDETAAALFRQLDEDVDDYRLDLGDFKLDLDDVNSLGSNANTFEIEDEGRRQATTVVSVAHHTAEKQFQCSALRADTAHFVAKSEINDALPLPEATLDDLIYLSSFLDPSLQHNVNWLQTNQCLIPNLNLLESTQLQGFLHVLVSLKAEVDQFAASADKKLLNPYHVAIWFEDASSQSAAAAAANIDTNGCRFLFAYYHALSVTSAYANLFQIASEIGEVPALAALHGQFPIAVSSLTSAEGELKLLSSLEPLSQSSAHLPSAVPSPFALTTSDLCWAVHCESDDVLIHRTLNLWKKVVSRSCPAEVLPKLSWSVLRFVRLLFCSKMYPHLQAGVGFWLKNPLVAIKLASEDIPRDIYASQSQDDKNPDSVALWYTVSGKLSVLVTLYRAVKNVKVVEFLSNNFEEERWKLAAIKNAYALLRQKRFELATSFFILGGSYLEAIDVCCGQMDDPQLALFLSLILDYSSANKSGWGAADNKQSGGLRAAVLRKKILPLAIYANDSWLQCTALWLLGHYEESIIATLPPGLRPCQKHGAEVSQALVSSMSRDSKEEVDESTISATSGKSIEVEDRLNSKITMHLVPDPFQGRHTSIRGPKGHDTFTGSEEELALIADDSSAFCCNSLRFSPINPSIPMFRRYLLETIQFKRALQGSMVVSEFLDVVKSVCRSTKEERSCSEIRAISSCAQGLMKAEVQVSAAVVAAVIVLCEDVVNILDLAESLLFCLSHRLPFQGLQHFTDILYLTERFKLGLFSGSSVFSSASFVAYEKSWMARGDTIRIRWNCAVGCAQHACDALVYLTAIKLKENEHDVDWMERLFQDTVETFGGKTSPLKLAASAWKRVVDKHGCERYYPGENFQNWVARQFAGPEGIQSYPVSTTIDLPMATPGPSAPVVDAESDKGESEVISVQCKEHIRNQEGLLVDVLEQALRGMPIWSLLSSQQSWSEEVVFRGLSTCTLGLIDLLGNATNIGTFGPHAFHTVLAKTLTLQAGTKSSVAWASQSTVPDNTRKLLLSAALLASGCVSVASVLLLLMRLLEKGTDEECDELEKLADNKIDAFALSRWLTLPMQQSRASLWKKLEEIFSHLDRLECYYLDVLDSVSPLGLKDVDLNAPSTDSVSAELLRHLDFLHSCILLPQENDNESTAGLPTDVGLSEAVANFSSGAITLNPMTAPNAKGAHVITPRSEPLKCLLKVKGEAALEFTLKTIGAGEFVQNEQTEERKESLRQLLLSVLHSAVIDRLLTEMATTAETSRALYGHFMRQCSLADAVQAWTATVEQSLVAFQALVTRLRLRHHGQVAVDNYESMIGGIATKFPFLPLALASSLAPAKDPHTVHDESVEILEVDNACIILSIASGACDVYAGPFRRIWALLHCSWRLQLLIGRGPSLGFPFRIGVESVCSDLLPINSRVIVCLKEAPLSVSVDKAADTPFVHHCGSFGPGPSSYQPLLFGLPAFESVGGVGRSGLGIMSVSTSHGVWETNIVHSVMFHRPFGALTGGLGPAALGLQMPASSEKADGDVQKSTRQVLSHSANVFHLHVSGHATATLADFDDDETKYANGLSQGRLRINDLAAEVYERQVAELAYAVFNSSSAFSRLAMQDAIRHEGASCNALLSETSNYRTAEESSGQFKGPKEDSRSKRRITRVRPHWQINHRHKLSNHSTMQMHTSSKPSATTTQLSSDSQQLPMYHYNLLTELLLHGLVGPLADIGVPRLEASLQAAAGAVGRTSVIDEEAPLVASGLCLLPLPNSPQVIIQAQKSGNRSAGALKGLNSDTTSPESLHKSTVAWLCLIAMLQQRHARNNLVELQLACLPPTPPISQNTASPLQHLPDHGRPMSLLRPHPKLPVCAGVIADSQVVSTSHGTLVISLWKVGEPHIKGLGCLGMHPVTSNSRTTATVTSMVDPQRPSTSPDPGRRVSNAHGGQDARAMSATEGKRGAANLPFSDHLGSGSGASNIGISYSEAGLIKSLEWNGRGDELVAGHNKGWVSVWQLRSDKHARVDAAIPQRHQKDELVQMGLLEGSNRKAPDSFCIGLPVYSFKPHLASCRFAKFLDVSSGGPLLITSGKGLAPTQVMTNKLSKLSPMVGGKTETAQQIASASVEEGVVCVWNTAFESFGTPKLLAFDNKFEKGGYATEIVAWPAKQKIFYCSKKGEIRCIDFLSGQSYCILNPVKANQIRLQKQRKNEVSKNEYEPSNSPSLPLPGAGLFGKEIVRMFLLEDTRRLLTCYEDAMIRVWDLASLWGSRGISESYQGVASLASPPQAKPNGVQGHSALPASDCLPLLWESAVPLHGQDTSRLSLVASIMGAVFNVAPGGAPRALLDAQMASPNHLISVGADGLVVLTRI